MSQPDLLPCRLLCERDSVGRFDFVPGLHDGSPFVYEERRPYYTHILLAHHGFFGPDTVRFRDRMIFIAQQRESQLVLIVELLLSSRRIGANTDRGHTGCGQIRQRITHAARLFRTPRRARPRIEIDQQLAATCRGASLGVAAAQFKKAYYRLPLVADDKLPIAEAFMDLAATVVGEIEHSFSTTRQIRELAWTTGYEGGPAAFGQAFDLELLRMCNFSSGCADSKNGFTLTELVKSMVTRNPAMPYTVTSIARAARLTPNHLSMLFHRETGQTFTDFLTEQRLELAKELLKDIRLTVSEVAHRAGFADPAYFSRRFKNKVGISPTEWRRRG